MLSSTACAGKFQCKNQRCIKPELKCDGWNDCGDMSDEVGCSECCSRWRLIFRYPLQWDTRLNSVSFPACNSKDITCKNGLCKPMFWKCDGVDDCGDKTDEQNCGETLRSWRRKYLSPATKSVNHSFFMLPKADVQLDNLVVRTRNVFQRRVVATEETTVAMGRMNSAAEEVRKC